ncbi:MAG: prenyltransferase/squalene oxidase repeat-containing protein [Phycisphaerae bacterium]
MSRCLRALGLVMCLSGQAWGVGAAATAPGRSVGRAQLPPALLVRVERAIDRALVYLQAVQEPHGGWVERSGPGITALVAKCFVQDDDYGPAHPVVRQAVRFILTYRHEDGGIYADDMGLRNYHTSVVLMLLSVLPDDEATIRRARRGAVRFLKRLQWDEGEGKTPRDVWYGGAGYGKGKRPDLSNTQMMLEALHQSGLPPSDPVYRKALRFISRCQMLSHSNDQPFAGGANDGGFIYSPVGGGQSKAGYVVVGGRQVPRSYGSMTYAGFKSMLYADLRRDDPRVKAGLEWIRRHYDLDSNPNMPGARSKEGLFYYYHVFAKALAAWGEPEIVDVSGRSHNWRVDLAGKLLELQGADGSWVNQADRWMEGLPQLASAYAVLALQTAIR